MSMKDEVKNVIFLKKDIPQRIKKEVHLWNCFAKLAPVVALLVGYILYNTGILDLETILITAAIIFAGTAVTWWFWTVNTIGHISDRVHKAENGVTEVLAEIRLIRKLFQEINKSK